MSTVVDSYNIYKVQEHYKSLPIKLYKPQQMETFTLFRPYETANEDWSNDIKHWPKFDKALLGKQNGFSLYKSGNVGEIFVYKGDKVSSTYSVVKCQIKEVQENVCIAFNNISGSIDGSHCFCETDSNFESSHCVHVDAVLFKIDLKRLEEHLFGRLKFAEELPPSPLETISLLKTRIIEVHKANENFTAEEILSNISYTDEELTILEEYTRDQAENPYWKSNRLFRITASVFHDVSVMIRRDPTELAIKLSAQGPNLDNIPAINWGKTNEIRARNLFIQLYGEDHINFSFTECGLYVRKDFPHFGASPDGRCSCSCHNEVIIEIKCPYSKRTENPVNLCDDEGFYLEKIDGCVQLKKTHQYYYQIQLQLFVTKLSLCKFIVWTMPDENHSEGAILVCDVSYDEEFINEKLEKCKRFYCDYVIPRALNES